MQKTLACVAMLLAGSLAGCGKDKHREPASAGHETQPAPVAQGEEQPMTPAAGTTEPMTPASGTEPQVEGTEPEGEGTEPVELGPNGPLLLQFEATSHLTQTLCRHEQQCGRITPDEPSCEASVEEQVAQELEPCTQGVSRAGLSECLSAIEQESCGSASLELSSLDQCGSEALCAP